MKLNRMAVTFTCVGLSSLLGCARTQPTSATVNPNVVKAIRAKLGSGADTTGGAAQQAVLRDPTGFATLKGTFKISAKPPVSEGTVATKDPEVCGKDGMKIPNESLVVDDNSGIKDVLIYVSTKIPQGNAAWEHADDAAKREATIEFDQKNCVFLSHMFAIRTTQKLKILNSDPVGHNTKISGNGNANSGNDTVSANGYLMFNQGGAAQSPFPVACSIHPWMAANMFTVDHPYFAVSKADGTFEVPHVPAGVPLEFRVWQEKAKYVGAAQVTSSGKNVSVAKGKFTYTFDNDEVTKLDFVIDAGLFNK